MVMSISFECPLCLEDLKLKKTGNQVEFTCSACGYNKRGPAGYSSSDAYEYLTTSRSKNKKPTTSSGFTTRSKRKRREKLSDQEEESLEEDPLILENVRKIRDDAVNKRIPSPLDRIVSNPEYMPVYYKKLEKHDPPKGNDISSFIDLTGLRDRLRTNGIDQLYAYQEEVFNEVMEGNNIVISAPTGMGKTEAFLLPIIYSLVNAEPNPRYRKAPGALLIYPTKALATDQLEKIAYYCKSVGLRVGKFDGDTPHPKRQMIYNHPPDILLTNADMIHYHLQGNISFQTMMSRVKFLVIDEIHLCTGSFGSNVLWIVRRLRRFSPYLQCIGASATISNAENFAETIFDVSVKLVSIGTARRSDMHLTMIYPKTRSNLSVMADIATNFVQNDHKTLVFGNGHKSAEVVNMMLEERNIASGVHRAGLKMSHRSRVETDFKNNKLDVLVSTPTLELGIDIGSLDSVVSMLTGITSFVQRIGRAGRSGQESFATLVLRGDDPISAYYARNPESYLDELDPAFVEPNNHFVAKHQLIAMIRDRPLNRDEALNYQRYVEELITEGVLKYQKNELIIRNQTKAKAYLKDYSIRGIGNSVDIMYMRNKIGDRSLPMALSELHPNAVYLSGGRSYEVMSYDPKLQVAKLSSSPTRHIRTQALRDIAPNVNDIIEETQINGLNAAYCELELTETVHGYTKQHIFNNKNLGTFKLDEPIDYTYSTMGFLIALPRPDDLISSLDDKTRQTVLGGTFHAIEHVLIESGNAFSGGGATQIGGISMGDTGLVFVYDGSEGGSGLSKLLYESLDRGLKRSMKIMEDCPCKRRDGCPRCTYSYQCGNNNQPLDRVGAIEALKRFGKDNTELFYNFDGHESFVIEPEWDYSWTLGLISLNLRMNSQ